MAVVRDFMVRLLADPKELVKAFGNIRKDGEDTFGDKGIGGSLNNLLPSFNKLAIASTAAFAGMAAFGAAAAKAAAEDAAEQDKLAKVLQNVTGATDEVVAANEQFISGLQRTTTFSDSEMRPALAALVAATGDLAEAQGMLRLAQDISIGTGLSLVDVSSALAKASNDNFKSLKALSPALADNIKEGQSLEQIFAELSATFGGSAAAAAGTLQGQMTILRNSLGEVVENIGAALLPAINAILPLFQSFADFAQRNSGLLIAVGAAAATFTGIIIALSTAMKVYTIATGIARLATVALGTTISVTPIGAIITLTSLAAGALAYFATKTDEAEEQQKQFNQALSATNQFLSSNRGIVTAAGDRFVELTNRMLKLNSALSTTTNQLFTQTNRLEALSRAHGVSTFTTGKFTVATSGAGSAVKTAAEKLKEYRDVLKQTETLQKALATSSKQVGKARLNVAEADAALAKAQQELNDAQMGGDPAKIKDAQRALAAAERNLARAKFDTEEAVFAVVEKEKELKELRADPGADPMEIRKAEIALAEAKFRVADAEDAEVKSARDLTDARRELRIATDGLKEGDEELLVFKIAVEEATKAQQDAAEQLIDALDGEREAIDDLADAYKRLAAAAKDAGKTIPTMPTLPSVTVPTPGAAVPGTSSGTTVVVNTGIGTDGREAARQIVEILENYSNIDSRFLNQLTGSNIAL